MQRIVEKLVLVLVVSCIGTVSALGFQDKDDNPETAYVDSLLSQAFVLNQQGGLDEARMLIAKADSLSQERNYTDGKARSVLILGNLYEREQKLDSAFSQYNFGIKEYSETQFLPDYYNGMGNVFDARGQSRQALEAFQNALDLTWMMEEKSREQFSAGLKMNMANAYDDLGNTGLAAENYLEAIVFADEAEYVPLMFLSRLNIGVLYEGMDNYETAVSYYEKAIEIGQEFNFRSYLYNAYNNLGVVKMKLEQFSEAEEYLFKAQEVFEEVNPGAPELIANHNLGELKRKEGNYSEAERYLKLSLENAQKINVVEAFYHNYLELGKLYLDVGNYEQALDFLNSTLQVAADLDNPDYEKEAQLQLYETYKSGQNYEEALKSHERYTTITDSLTQLSIEKDLANLESQLELRRQNEINRLLEEKQAQQQARIQFQLILIAAGGIILILIAILLFVAKRNAKVKQELLEEIQAQRDELQDLNKAKDQVFAMVSHDLRSPLTSVQGILDLIRDDILKGEDLKRLIDDIDSSVRQNVNVIEDLLAWAKDQLSGFDLDPKPMELNPLLADVLTTQSFLAIQKKIELRNNLNGEASTILADPNAMRVILRNLISNAIKYTNENGVIEVFTQEEKEKIIIGVKDDGVGIPESSMDKIFNSNTWTRVGTGKEKGSGFGLSMTKEFVEKMNGRIWFESEEGEGTTFYVELPRSE